MKRLYVFADFDWLKEPRLVGELSYESLRGSDSYGFCYSDDWLRDYGNLFLSDDLNNYPGQQYTAPGKDIFGCFSDALPDRWGRTLINRREQILAKEENLNELLDSCEEYMLQKHIAQQIISEVLNTVKHWQSLANLLGITKTEQNMFYTIFERHLGIAGLR